VSPYSRRLLSLAALTLLALGVGAGTYIGARRDAPPAALDELRQRHGSPQSKYVDVAGVSVHYRDEGSGPVLLLMHGSFGSLHMFDDLAALLADRYRIIRFDQAPGGLSGPVPAGFTMTPEAFTHEFLAKLGVGPVAVLGTSSGGIYAYRYAATYPQDVTAVVLSNVPPSAPVDNAGAARRQPWLTQLSSLTCAKFARPWSKTCWRDFLESLFVRRELVTDELVTRYYDLNRRPEASQFTTMTAIMREDAQVIDFLGRVEAPTLLIWGTDSKVLPPPTGQLMFDRLTGTTPELRVVERVAHYPPLEAPREIADLVGPFLAKVLAAREGLAAPARPGDGRAVVE
jgi:pimeloyl-ACP methyl ester carboxylesterase